MVSIEDNQWDEEVRQPEKATVERNHPEESPSPTSSYLIHEQEKHDARNAWSARKEMPLSQWEVQAGQIERLAIEIIQLHEDKDRQLLEIQALEAVCRDLRNTKQQDNFYIVDELHQQKKEDVPRYERFRRDSQYQLQVNEELERRLNYQQKQIEDTQSAQKQNAEFQQEIHNLKLENKSLWDRCESCMNEYMEKNKEHVKTLIENGILHERVQEIMVEVETVTKHHEFLQKDLKHEVKKLRRQNEQMRMSSLTCSTQNYHDLDSINRRPSIVEKKGMENQSEVMPSSDHGRDHDRKGAYHRTRNLGAKMNKSMRSIAKSFSNSWQRYKK